MRRSRLSLIALMLCTGATYAPAQYARPLLTRGVGIDQKLGSQVPLNLVFRDESGSPVALSAYFGEKPVVLAMVYYRCPNICNVTLNEMVSSLHRIALDAPKDYNVVVVSIDPLETPALAAEKKANYAKRFKKGSDAGWHFLTGNLDSISKLADAVGFHYRWDDASHQFVHAGGIMVATPRGKLARYLFGVQYAPQDLPFAIAEASHGGISDPVNALLLFCFHYDQSQGRYTPAIFNLLKVAGMLTVLALGIMLYFLSRPRARWEAHRVS